MKKKEEKTELENIDINEVKAMLRKVITEKYGSVAQFLKSDAGKKFGGTKIRTYFYDTGNVNYEFLSKLCTYFGIGKLTRKIVVTRTYMYQLNKSIDTVKKPS